MVDKINLKQPRSSNFELLRIVSMLLIIAHHYVVNSGLLASDGEIINNQWTFKSLYILIFGAWGKTGINCFVLITGYFMCKKDINLKKILNLLIQIYFYRFLFYFIFILTKYIKFSIHDLKYLIIPFTYIGNDFISGFLIFYLLIPFLNIFINNLKQNDFIKLLIILISVYVLFGSIYGFFFDFNYISWFIVLYFVAAYIRLYPNKYFNDIRFSILLLFFSLLFAVFSIILCTYYCSTRNKFNSYFFVSDSNKLFAFLVGFALFNFFKNIKIKYIKYINFLGSSCFGVLLIHANSDAMRKFLWVDLLKNSEVIKYNYIYIHSLFSVLAIFLICSFIDLIRINIFSLINNV